MRTNYKRIENIIKNNFGCDVEKSRARGIVAILERNEVHVRIVLVDGIRSYSDEVGIHLTRLENSGEDLERHLVDAIETASKDNFPAIFVHQTPKPNPERRESRVKAALQWMSKPRVELQHSLSRLERDPAEILKGMSEEQVDLLLAMTAGTYASSHSESREHWAPMYHNLRRALEARGLSSIETLDIAEPRNTKGA